MNAMMLNRALQLPVRFTIESSISLQGTSADPRLLPGVQYTSSQSPFDFEIIHVHSIPISEDEAKKEYFPFLEKVGVIEDLKKTQSR